MKKALFLILVGICSWTNFFAQTDSIKNEILNSPDTKSQVIAKGRKLIYEKLLSNDKEKVTQLLNYLVSQNDNDYFVFYQAEESLLYYWTQQYGNILINAIHNDSMVNAHRQKIGPPNDLLFQKIRTKLSEQKSEIINQINQSELKEEDKTFLALNLRNILAFQNKNDSTRDSLNFYADKYLENYPNGTFTDYIRKYIRYKYKPSKWGYGFEFFTGYGFFTQDLAGHFKNNIPVGVAFDISYKNIILYLRDYIGFGKTKDSIAFQSGIWRSNAQARVYLPEASLGYVALDHKHIKLVPFLGISSTSVSPTEHDKNKFPEYDKVGLNFTTTYTMGLNVDVKLGNKKSFGNTRYMEESYPKISIRYAYNKPQYNSKYSGFNGEFHYITVSFGGFGRKIKRDY